MSILDHPDWPVLRTYLRLEPVTRDPKPRGGVRQRIEVSAPRDRQVRLWLLGITSPCVACGRMTNRVTARRSWGAMYFHASCPQEISPGCGRTKKAAREYTRIETDLEGYVPPRSQLDLF